LQEKLRKEEKRFLSLQREWMDEFKKVKRDFQNFVYEMKSQIKDELKKIREGKTDEGLEKRYSRLQNTLSQLEKSGKKELRAMEVKIFPQPAFSPGEKRNLETLKVGDWVRSFSGIEGEIIYLKDNKISLLSSEGINWQLDKSDIEKIIEKVEKKESKGTTNFYVQSVYDISQEVDLRGLTKEDAIFQLDKFLSKVMLSQWQRVYIIHGKGEGILRKAVWEHLRENYPQLKFRLGGVGEGGSGVTVIEL
jgi:DNA mismatch repair protein MutS2